MDPTSLPSREVQLLRDASQEIKLNKNVNLCLQTQNYGRSESFSFLLGKQDKDLRLYTNCLLILPFSKSEAIVKMTSKGQTEEYHICWLVLMVFTPF